MILKVRGFVKRQDSPFVLVFKLFTLRRRRFCDGGKVGIPLLDFQFSRVASSSGGSPFAG